MNNTKMFQVLRISTFAALTGGCAATSADGEVVSDAPLHEDATLSAHTASMPSVTKMVEGSVCITTDTFAREFVADRVPLEADDNVYIEVLGAFACEVERLDDRIVVRPERDADSLEDAARCKLGLLGDGAYEVLVEGIEGARFPLEVPSRPEACQPAPAKADGMSAGLRDAAASSSDAELDRRTLADELSSDPAVEEARY